MAPDGYEDAAGERREFGARTAAGAADRLYNVRLRGFVAEFRIGVHPHELEAAQRVRVDVTVDVARPVGGFQEDYHRVYCYERLAKGIRKLAAGAHVALVETLADRIAELALADTRACRVEVTVEKLDVFADAEAAGVTVTWRR